MPRALSQAEIESFRGELCEVATRRFAEAGYAGVTLRGLATELGVSPMTPYRYFENKEEIFAAVRIAALERFGDHCERAAAEAAHLPPVEQLKVMGRGYVRFGLENPHAYRIIFQLEQNDAPELEGYVARCWASILAATRRAVEQGDLVGDPDLLAHICWVGLHGIVTLQLARKLSRGIALDQLLDPMMDTILRGAAPSPPSEGASPCEEESPPS